jgi:hypothetical protein
MRPIPLQQRNIGQRVPIHHHQISERPGRDRPDLPCLLAEFRPTTVAEWMISAGVSTLASSSNSMQWYFFSPPRRSEPKAIGRPASRMISRDLSPPERTTSILSN